MVDPNNPNSDNYDNGRDFEAPVDINRPPLLGNLWEFSKKYLQAPKALILLALLLITQ